MKRFPGRVCLLLVASLLTLNGRAQTKVSVVHVFVALADNAHQGIVPVPAALGNGDDADRSLYWGAAFGLRTVFKKSDDWEQIGVTAHPNNYVIERRVFRHKASGTYLIADAYRGSEIKRAVADFFSGAAGLGPPIQIDGRKNGSNPVNQTEDLAVYVGHDGLMDFAMEQTLRGNGGAKRQAIILACASKQYFGAGLRSTGAEPVLWTTNLMAPEAYTLKAALDGWIAGETGEQIRERAASAYAKYQKISEKAAMKLFASGW